MSFRGNPFRFAEDVTPSDVIVFDAPTAGLYIGGAGDVIVRMHAKQNLVTFPAVPAGSILPGEFDQVRAGTGATGIRRLWN